MTAVSEIAGPVDRVAPPLPFADRRNSDVGIFSDLDAKVDVDGAAWLSDDGVVVGTEGGDSFLFRDGVAVRWMGNAKPDVVVENFGSRDRDRDGIPDQFDILLGAKKAELNAAPYGSPYRKLEYPGGDVPRGEGVCTDVVIRALRNAGVDLQRDLHEDIKAAPRAFRMVKKPDPNIDQRRVKTLLPHFQRKWDSRVTAVSEDWLPGDIVFMNTMGDDRPDHIGVVSDERAANGAPKIINNWTDGYSTQAMELVGFVPITHRFRLPGRLKVPGEAGGLEGALARAEVGVPAGASQVVLARTPAWTADWGTLHRFERTDGGWREVGEPVPVTLGSAGSGEGRGLESQGGLSTKVEGDRKSPTGVFKLGTAFGRAKRPFDGDWPYRRTTSKDLWVDDADSPFYNTWVLNSEVKAAGEALDMYRLALVVEHNTEPIVAGQGSAIFIHTWQGEPAPTLGCTAMRAESLEQLLAWLDPSREPVLVQVVGELF